MQLNTDRNQQALPRCLQPPVRTQTSYALVDVQLEFLLGDALLDPLAEGGVSSRAAAALPVLDQAAALPVERRGRRPVVAVLLGAESVHPARTGPSEQGELVCEPEQRLVPTHTEPSLLLSRRPCPPPGAVSRANS